MKKKGLLCLMIYGVFQLLHRDFVYANDIILPEDTIEFNDHSYKYYEEATDWHSAKEICEKYGGYLVTITSVEENEFLICNLPNSNKSFYWIGATDEAQEGIWRWANGEKFSYNNWSDSSPNNNNEKEHYAGFMNKEENYDGYSTPIGSWNDFELFPMDDGGFICEWDFVNEKEIGARNQQSKTQNFGKTEDNNDGINTIFYINNLSLIDGISIFGGISLIGIIIKNKKKAKSGRNKSAKTQ